MRVHSVIAFIISLLILPLCSSAQWTQVSPTNLIGSGPYGNQGALAYADGVAWAGLYDIYRSTDRGTTWTKVTSPWRSLGGYIIWISFLDRNNGCVCGENGLLITHDGGATWSKNFWGKNIFCAAFLGTDKDLVVGNRPDYTLEVSHDGGRTWSTKSMANDALLKDMRLFEPGHVIGFVEYAYAKGNASAVVESTDFGESWKTFAGRTDPDSHSFEVLRCDHSIVLGLNEEVGNYTGQDGTGEINRSTDGGASFTTILTRGNGVLRGSIVATAGVIYVPSSPGQFLESLDAGVTWTAASGPSFPSDSHGLIAIDDTTLLAANASGTIFRRIDPRGAVIVSAANPLISPMNIAFSKSYTQCSPPDTLSVSIAKTCSTADVQTIDIIAPAPDAPSLAASRSGDIIQVVFTPLTAGILQASLKLTLTNGKAVTIPITATVHETVKPTFSTTNLQTDTIGATIYIPVHIRTDFDLADLRFSVNYDTTDLQYVGATFDTLAMDLTERSGIARARIHLPRVGTDTANVVWIAFRYFPTQACTSLTIDSMSYSALVSGVCSFDTAMTATICAPPDCNQTLLSHYIRYRQLTLADVHFSSAERALLIHSIADIPDAAISIVNSIGSTVYRSSRDLRSTSTERIQLPSLPSGAYTAQITAGARYQTFRFEYIR